LTMACDNFVPEYQFNRQASSIALCAEFYRILQNLLCAWLYGATQSYSSYLANVSAAEIHIFKRLKGSRTTYEFGD
jgi:hypothetical protein